MISNSQRKTGIVFQSILICLAIVLTARQTTALEKKKPAEVTVQIQSWKEVHKNIASHKGKVVVVDIWTTTCLSCIEEFPKFVELRKKFGKDKMVLVSLNCDYDGIKSKPPEYYRENVLKFLKKNKATFDNVMLNVSFLAFLEEIKLDSTPAILIYDQTGKLAKRFDNDDAKSEKEDFSMNDVEALIERLLKN